MPEPETTDYGIDWYNGRMEDDELAADLAYFRARYGEKQHDVRH